MIFPTISYKDLGVTFVLGSGAVRYVLIDTVTHVNDIAINPGMNLAEICDRLGAAEVNETWKAAKTIKVYEIHYVIDGLKYKFLSRHQDGKVSELVITEDW